MTGATEPRQLTFGGRNRFPAWSHDGTRVLFQSDRDGDLAVFWQRADGGGAPERLTEPDKGTSYVPYSSSPDGGVILLDALHIVSTPPTHSLAVLSLKDRSVKTFGDVRASRVSTMPDFSRDGRWVAYTFGSLESATVAVYVQPFPATGEKHLVESRAFFPMWSPSRDELLFVQGGGGFQAAAITANPSFTVKNPTPVSFSRQIRGNALEERSVDVMPDGERLISVVPRSEPGAAAGPQIHIVLNWFEELKRRAPAP
jgi:WD40 repeat protein